MTADYKPSNINLDTFQKVLGVSFKQPQILQTALTHRSYVNENGTHTDIENNERLEFLGDAILDFVTADMLYERYPGMAEGEMTRLRSALVRTESLAQFALEVHVGEALLMGKGESGNGGRERETNLCRGFEAVVGAIYLDQGLQAVKRFILPRLIRLEKDVMDEAINKDPRSQFQEWAQAVFGITPMFNVTGTEGPEHDKVFIVGAFLGDISVASGRGRSKRAASHEAARNALALVDVGEFPLEIPPKKRLDLPEADSDERDEVV